MSRSYLKKVFCPNLCVGSSIQVLDILEYACGLKLGPALILSQNPDFEMAYSRLPSRMKLRFKGSEVQGLVLHSTLDVGRSMLDVQLLPRFFLDQTDSG